MGDNRQTYKLSDIAKLRNGAAIKQEYFTDAESGVNLVKVSNFTTNSIDISGVTKVDIEHAKKWITHRIKANDILIATVGSWPPNWSSVVGKVVRAPSETHGAIQNQNTCCIIPSEQVDQDYLYYLLKTKCFLEWIVNSAQGSANQARVPVKNIGDFSIELPSIDYQAKISKILNAIDIKINLNSQINQTLEQMAQALFKSWFVDFDPVIDNALDAGFFEQDLAFSEELLRRAELRKTVRESDDFKPLSEDIRQLFPDAFEEGSEPALGLGGWVPKGWNSSPVGSLIELIGGGTPKTSESSYWGGDIPWFSVVDAPNDSDVFVIDTEKKITELGIQNSSAKILKVGTTIISARGTVGKCALVSKPMAINQSCYGIVGKNGVHDYFIYYLIRHSVSYLQQRSHGSVFSTITRDTFSSFNFIFSGQLIANAFGETISFWFEKIDRNNQQNYFLQNLRDTLLPKLISGELSLDDIKIDIPEETLI